jgi:Flp pilus assembly pilin Flp
LILLLIAVVVIVALVVVGKATTNLFSNVSNAWPH